MPMRGNWDIPRQMKTSLGFTMVDLRVQECQYSQILAEGSRVPPPNCDCQHSLIPRLLQEISNLDNKYNFSSCVDFF